LRGRFLGLQSIGFATGLPSTANLNSMAGRYRRPAMHQRSTPSIAQRHRIIRMDVSPCALLRMPALSHLITRHCYENGMRRRFPRNAGLARSAWRTRLGFKKVRGGAWLWVFRSWFRSPDGAQRNPGTTSPASRPPDYASLHPGYEKLKEAERRQTQGNNRRILRCGARPFGARTLDGVPPRLSPEGVISSQRLSFRPGFLGLGLNGRYPPSPVPVQGCTSHPGHNAGRLIPKPPESRLQTRPQAPPSLP
jgi:hypothetical protein